MTREEAIQFLTETGISPEHIMELVEVLEQEPCTDAISREAVIDIIEDVCPIYGNDYRYILRDKVNELPPVTPAEKVGQIDAAVLDKIREEIKSKKFGLTDTEDGRRIQSDIYAGFDGGIECALQIIDKYKAESEG